jgi:hypothetical protein
MWNNMLEAAPWQFWVAAFFVLVVIAGILADRAGRHLREEREREQARQRKEKRRTAREQGQAQAQGVSTDRHRMPEPEPEPPTQDQPQVGQPQDQPQPGRHGQVLRSVAPRTEAIPAVGKLPPPPPSRAEFCSRGNCGHRRINHASGACEVAHGGVRVDDCRAFLEPPLPPLPQFPSGRVGR